MQYLFIITCCFFAEDGNCRNVQRLVSHVHSHCSLILKTFSFGDFLMFTTCSGFYIHLESSNPRSKGESVRFESPYVISSYKCVTFWYHMWGKHVGRLNIFVAQNLGSEKLKWRLSGNQGDSWIEGSTGINNTFAYKVRKNYC